jgi:23S rRNA (uracil1939-C5)-methyltransferase
MIKKLITLAENRTRLKKKLSICYVSCNPVSLARDVAMLCAGDSSLTPTVLQPVDMLPHTSHLESICILVND